jgi:uncharacterized iron-regulated membrane protein
MRKTIRTVHLWLGLVSGLILSVLGITGSIYVFEPEITRAITKEYHTQNEKSIFSSDIEIVSEIEKQSGKKIESLQWPQRGRDTYVFKLFDDNKWHYFDQSAGKIIWGNEGYGNSFFAFILDLHTSLTLGEIGFYITATASLIFALFMLTTGVYLWWPRVKGRMKSSFKIKWNAQPKRFNYDLHNVIGFYFFLPLFLLGITGAAFHYYEETRWVLDKITFSQSSPKSIWDTALSDSIAHQTPITTQQALAEMNKYYPDYYKRNMWMTNKKDGTLSFAYQKYQDVHSGADTRIFLIADRYTGAILAEQHPDKLQGGASILSKWLLPIHFGEFGGIITRILWFIAGFIPALLTWTGVKIWLGRTSKDKAFITRDAAGEPAARSVRSAVEVLRDVQ